MARDIVKSKEWRRRAKEWRDEAVVKLRFAIQNPENADIAVDSIIAAAVGEINANLRQELEQIRALVHANPEETTYSAVRRLMTERDGLALKYRDSRERMKDVISDLKTRIRELERDLEEARRAS